MNNYYLYTGNDSTHQVKSTATICDSSLEPITRPIQSLDQYTYKDVKMLNTAFPSPLGSNETLDKIVFKNSYVRETVIKEAEVIYMIPKNYGKKINSISLIAKLKSSAKMNVCLHKIERQNNCYVDNEISVKNGLPIDDYLTYEFDISPINMEAIYYLLITQ